MASFVSVNGLKSNVDSLCILNVQIKGLFDEMSDCMTKVRNNWSGAAADYFIKNMDDTLESFDDVQTGINRAISKLEKNISEVELVEQKNANITSGTV